MLGCTTPLKTMSNDTRDPGHEHVDAVGPAGHDVDSRLWEALGVLTDGIAVFDADGLLIFCNEGYSRVNGYSEADIELGVATYDGLGRLDLDNQTIDSVPLTFVERIAKLRLSNSSVVIQHHNDRIYERRVTATPSGGLVTLTTDITAHHKLELIQDGRNKVLELLATGHPLENVLTALIKSGETLNPKMLGSVLVLDESGRHLLVGAAPRLPKFYNDAIHGVEIGIGVGSCGTAAFTGKLVIVDDISTDPYWVDFRDHALKAGLCACWSQPIFSTGGKVLGTFAMYYKEICAPNEDDLKFISNTAHLAGIAIETHQREEARKSALSKAEQASVAKSEFLATMSHELRTPLNAILGFSEMLKGQHNSGMTMVNSHEYAADIHESGMHLLALINDVLDISTIEAGQRQVFMEAIDLDDLLKDCLRNIEQQAVDAGIDLLYETPENLPSLHAEKRSVIQIVLNLLSNAIKFTDPGGTVVLSAAVADETISIEVRDTGIGIPPDRLPNVTEPFYQGHADPYKTQIGIGLGLSIVKSLVDLHGGDMGIISEVGTGTTMTVTLPRQGDTPGQ